nr:glycine cleavage system H protein, mitochondrial-like [Ipomoea batatas]
MALRIWASSTANALRLSTASSKPNLSPAAAFSLSRCFSSVLEGLKYAKSHEWVKSEGSVATIGITDHAQDHLGEVVFVELPDVGTAVKQGSSFGAVESVKATSDVNSPISGEVVEVNTKLTEGPGVMQNKHDHYFTVRRNEALQTVLVGFCKLEGIEFETIRFLFDGKRAQECDTPEKLGMEEEDASLMPWKK